MTQQTTQTQHTPTTSPLSKGGILQRKCEFCGQHTIAGGECEGCKKKQKFLQPSATNKNAISEVIPTVQETLNAPGQPLDSDIQEFMGARFGHDFSQVRVHTDSKAAESTLALNALAYTVNQDVVFGAGQYVPYTSRGIHLLAHELTHTVQQSRGGNAPLLKPEAHYEQSAESIASAIVSGETSVNVPDSTGIGITRQVGQPIEKSKNSSIQKATQVTRVIISCADNIIVFETPEKSYAYKLAVCDVTEGNYDAGVSVVKNKVTFNLGKNVLEGIRFRFSFDVEPGQKNPAILFQGQTKVPIEVTKQSLSKAEQAVFIPLATSASGNVLTPYEAFKRLVRNAGKARMASNRQALELWKNFLKQKLTPSQVANQTRTEEMRRLIVAAEHKGTVSVLDEYGHTKNPAMREYQRGLITGERCPSCHAILQAESYEKSANLIEKSGQDWIAPTDQLNAIAQSEKINPSARPNFLPKQQQNPALPESAIINNPMYPTASSISQSVQKIQPFMQPLGPEGYQVLPKAVMESKAEPSALLAEIIRHIEQRQADFMEFSREIDDPDFDYMMLRPIVRDLLPLASPQVRAQVNADIETAETWDTIKSIVIGIATIALLLMVIFPPTSTLGVASLATLEAGLSTYSIYSGIESYKQGRLLSLGRGANDVLDPEQQQAADLMMAMGILNVTLGVVGLRAAGLRGVKLLRTTPKATTDALGALEGIEAQAGDKNVKITGLNTENPQIKITSSEGTVIKEGPIKNMSPRQATTGDPALDAEIDRAFSTLEKGNVPGGAAADSPTQSELGVRVPVKKSGEPAEVLEVGAGPKKVDLGVPPEKELVAVTRSDISTAGKPDLVLDATGPIPPNLHGKFTTMIINNPYGYAPNIAELSKGLAPGGKIIIQGNWEANKFFRQMAKIDLPKGLTRTVERDVTALGKGFSYTDPSRVGTPIPNSRITFEFAPQP